MKKKEIKNNPVLKSVPAGSSLVNKTGAWRTLKPITDNTRCVGCSLCAKLCPEACIAMNEDKKIQSPNKLRPVTDYDYCKGCGLCAHECPVKAIAMEKDF